ncbi:MAG: hypothetical protein VKN72_07670 [Nostocales cyanobacterium 94392]|nr:hypothetical protein [Nostocales cyanobacterium 94392]
MTPIIAFETVLQFLAITYAVSTIFILLVTQICLAIIETQLIED